jgi:osmotically-inducible protein OsmY
MKIHHVKLCAAVTAAAAVTGVCALAATASEMDSRIELSAKESYVYKTFLKDDAITIQSTDGAVTLSGSVADESHKALAHETVANLPGVKGVDNQLVVKESPVEYADEGISMRVKTALLLHRNVNVFKTEVYTRNGVVTLKGEAMTEEQKELTGEYAGDVIGVKDVENEMTVAGFAEYSGRTADEIIDDASVTAQVKVALFFHRSTRDAKTEIKTRNGAVTISGTAGNEAQKALVSKRASDVNGVKSVVNKMTVKK